VDLIWRFQVEVELNELVLTPLACLSLGVNQFVVPSHSQGRPMKPTHLVDYCLKPLCNIYHLFSILVEKVLPG
jgi:hypothetical protein